MKNKELIELLKAYEPDQEVVIETKEMLTDIKGTRNVINMDHDNSCIAIVAEDEIEERVTDLWG
ncbi:hypothetical protein SAMN02910327_00402 [Peptostreptococcaceae bacterium pGA-8]|nr:hypothetical protein SAMN02910327_00402 [Peptostreptococcaceae bacterium pGA-8]